MTMALSSYKLTAVMIKLQVIDSLTPTEAFCALRTLQSPFIISGGTLPGQSRFSYVSAEPFIQLKTDHLGETTIMAAEGLELEFARSKEVFSEPFTALSALLKHQKSIESGPFPFSGGAVGFFSYELKNLLSTHTHGQAKKNLDKNLLAHVGFYDPIFVYDHTREKGFLVTRSPLGSKADKSRFELMLNLLKNKNKNPIETPAKKTPSQGLVPSSNLTREEFTGGVQQALKYISAGDIYQINLSQRLSVPFNDDPFELYLRTLNERPSRFPSYHEFSGGTEYSCFQIISNSPERLLSLTDRLLITEPIKGTRPRGQNTEEDARLTEELANDPKELAEHLMIVDLERSDIGKIAEAGSVSVKDFKRIESYPTLHHMVSTIEGVLLNDLDAALALKNFFPGGSITGTPKIRAMEIIDEIEDSTRGVYTGAIGWIDLAGDMDMSIAIRTAVCRDKKIELSVGSGIVADSQPSAEYEETLLKAEDMLHSLRLPTIASLKNRSQR